MKKHLINLLLEQFKQDYLVSRLDALGIEMQVASIDITHVVYDMVGIPPDNSAEYYHPFQEGTPGAVGKKKFDGAYCSRYWLEEKYHECISSKANNVKISAISRGLNFECPKQEQEVVEAVSTFVDWLYEQVEVLKMSRQEVC